MRPNVVICYATFIIINLNLNTHKHFLRLFYWPPENTHIKYMSIYNNKLSEFKLKPLFILTTKYYVLLIFYYENENNYQLSSQNMHFDCEKIKLFKLLFNHAFFLYIYYHFSVIFYCPCFTIFISANKEYFSEVVYW